jgi:hypothetical protein
MRFLLSCTHHRPALLFISCGQKSAVTLTRHHNEHYQNHLRFVFRRLLTTKNGSQKSLYMIPPSPLPTLTSYLFLTRCNRKVYINKTARGIQYIWQVQYKTNTSQRFWTNVWIMDMTAEQREMCGQ